MSNSLLNRLEGESHIYPSANNPIEIIHIDHFGPLQETESKHKYILVMVDTYTRFTWLCATQTTSAKETIAHLKPIFDVFGKPKEIVSDRGTAFTAKEFSDFVENLSIKHRKVAVAAPWANGLVERINRYIKSSLTKIASTPDEWQNKLGKMQYAVNNTYHSAIKSSPSKLMLGYEGKNHDDFPFSEFVNYFANSDLDLDIERAKKRDLAKQASDLVRQYNKIYRDSHSKKPTLYKEGEYVLVRDTRFKPGVNSKLKPNYKGPYVIKKYSW